MVTVVMAVAVAVIMPVMAVMNRNMHNMCRAIVAGDVLRWEGVAMSVSVAILSGHNGNKSGETQYLK